MCRIIDRDESDLHLKDANKKYGLPPTALKIRKPGNYDRGTFKLTIVLAVETGDPAIPNGQIGSRSRPWIWCQIRNIAGTLAVAYTSFVEEVLNTYTPVMNPGDQRSLIYDNLASHKSSSVYETIRRQGHRVICRPPGRPQDGPVDFAINQACERLQNRWAEVKDLASITRVLQEIIDYEITGMDDLFIKCGYHWN